MAVSTTIALPESVCIAVREGTPLARACREHLGYSIEDIAIMCGLTVEEVEKIETGHRFEKGYRNRITRALKLPEGFFDEISDLPDAA